MDKIKPEKNNEMKIGNLPEKGFRIMIMNIIQDLGKIMNKVGKRTDKHCENFYKEMENILKVPIEVTDMKLLINENYSRGVQQQTT